MDWPEILGRIHQALNVSLFSISGTSVSLASILTVIIIILVSFWISRVLQRIVGRGLHRRGVRDAGTVSTTQRLLHYGVIVTGLGIAIQTIGVNLSALFAAGAVLAVAIGFAMQNILQNFVSGVILLAERTITEQDVLAVDGRVVRVNRMGPRATVARTRDDEELIIPNSVLVQSTVTNYTLRDSLYRIRTQVGLTYSSDMRQVMEVLEMAARGVERHEAKEPLILLREFGDSSVVFDVSVWIDDPWASDRVRSKLNEAIWWALKDAGITIAFPQLDLHLPDQLPPLTRER
jgi:small-conductance mechanosensitive channel